MTSIVLPSRQLTYLNPLVGNLEFSVLSVLFTPSMKKVKKQLQGLGDARVNLLGFSLGGAALSGCLAVCVLNIVYIACAGAVAVAFAHRYPERVSILDRILLWLVSGKQVKAMCKCTKATLIHGV